MTECVHFPRDLHLRNEVRLLARALASRAAAHSVTHELWMELGMQAESHGKSGFFAREMAEVFTAGLDGPEANEMRHLTDCKLLIEKDGGWYCPIFAEFNEHLNARTIDQWAHLKVSSKKTRPMRDGLAATLIERLPAAAWVKADGSKSSSDEINRALVLIHVLDGLASNAVRTWEDYSVGLMHAAGHVIAGYDSRTLGVIFKRLELTMIKAKARAEFPEIRNTEKMLMNFEDIVKAIMPDEGFINWAAKRAKKHGPEQSSDESQESNGGSE